MTKDKVRGMMLGVAISDQLGMPVETYTREKIAKRHGRITSYIDPDPDHKWFGGMKSRWTDDTQLTLVVAESLIAKKKIDMDDMAARHVAALKEGDLGWGRSTREATRKLTSGTMWHSSGLSNGVGNGVAMKVAPLAVYTAANIWIRRDELQTIDIWSINQLARMTHQTDMAEESAFAQVAAAHYCLGSTIKSFSRDDFMKIICEWSSRITSKSLTKDTRLSDRLKAFKLINLEKVSVEDKLKIFGSGQSCVYDSLPFCYSMFLENPTSIETLYNTINAGGDTDTNGSIVGALLGALNGTKIFPEHLVNGLWQRDRILDTADKLCEAFNIAWA